MKAQVEFEELAQPPLVLHEVVATGIYRGKTVDLVRTIDSSTMYLTYRGKTYKIMTADLVSGVLEAEGE